MLKIAVIATLLGAASPAWSYMIANDQSAYQNAYDAPVPYYSEDWIAPEEQPATGITIANGLAPAWRYVSLIAEPNQAASNPTKVPVENRRPRMAGSSTGYIDNAIVGSQIRLRFDGDFNLQNPDRAEFFYAKCGCYRPTDPNAPGPGNTIAKSANLQELQLNVEYAPTHRVSVFAEVPVRWIQFSAVAPGSIPSASGIGDFRAGFKFALMADENRYLTFQMRAYFPSGDSRLGLGTNHYSVEPTLLYYQRFAERFAVSSEFGDWHPIGGSNSLGVAGSPNPNNGFAGDILLYGLGAGYDLYSGSTYRFTPVLEFVGWSILGGYVTEPPPVVGTSTSGVNIVNVKIGARLTIGVRNSIYVGYGHALTNATWYQNLVRLEYRFVF